MNEMLEKQRRELRRRGLGLTPTFAEARKTNDHSNNKTITTMQQ